MNAIMAEIRRHSLIGIDSAGELCSCGDRQASFLDHLASVTLGATEGFRR